MIIALLAILLTLLIVVGVHEAGHALAAQLFGVKIQRISFGFGKPIFTWKDSKQREWVWARWPLGGYVQLLNTRNQVVDVKDYPQSFDKKPIWQRCFVLLAGGFANFMTTFIAFTLIFLMGYNQQPPLIAEVSPNSIASQSGIQGGDEILAINNQQVDSWQDTGMYLLEALGQPSVTIQTVNPQGHKRNVQLDLRHLSLKSKGSLLSKIGLKPNVDSRAQEHVPGKTLGESLILAAKKVMQLLHYYLVILKQLVTGNIPFSLLLGPLGLISVSVMSLSQGLTVFLFFIASFSLAVGLVNLLPIPGLDGGSILYAIIEKIRGKPISVELEVLLHRLAFIMFCVLLVQLINNDIQRL